MNFNLSTINIKTWMGRGGVLRGLNRVTAKRSDITVQSNIAAARCNEFQSLIPFYQ